MFFYVNISSNLGTYNPTNLTVEVGQIAEFFVKAIGTNLQYQWQKNGVDIIGETYNKYVINSVSFSDSGWYRCVIKSATETVISAAAKLSVLPISVTDADGNVYTTVVIGNQIWTVENLRTTKYNDGTPIPHVTDSAKWVNLTTPGYCFYNNTTSETNKQKYGALYNWYAVNTGKLAPSGWRVPTDADWTKFKNYLAANGYYDSSSGYSLIAKSLAAKTDWRNSTKIMAVGNNLSINNSTDFSALPAGCRSGANFVLRDINAFWWSSTEYLENSAYHYSLSYDCDTLGRTHALKNTGNSIRLIKDLR